MKRNVPACLVCNEPLEYLDHSIDMECSFCHKTFKSNARCVSRHYVCDECHSKQGIQVIRQACLSSQTQNPLLLAQEIMKNPYIYMHGPEHHVMVGAVLLTAYKNSGGEIDLEKAIDVMIQRGSQVPGGICGLWGCCGAAVSTGIFVSIITGSTPLSGETWGLSNEITSQSLSAIGKIGGPRCCKRDSFTAILHTVDFVKEHFGIKLELPPQITCSFHDGNGQCLRKKCPYFRG